MGLVTAIGLGLSAAAGVASASSSNKASKRAAETSQKNTDANVALARDIYGNNQQVLSPFFGRGNEAGNQINALLGLGGSQQPMQASPQPNALSQFSGPVPQGGVGAPYGLSESFLSSSQRADAFPQAGGFQGEMLRTIMQGAPGQTSQVPVQPSITYGGPLNQAGATTGQTSQQAANDAFDIFRNSTGYQFRLNEGYDAVNSGYAGAGALQSGAAMKAITDYGQNMASNEFANYMNALGAQQAVGAGAASSLAGVGQNYAGTVINANNMNAANQANAQLSQQNAFGNVAGMLGAGLFQYGLGGG